MCTAAASKSRAANAPQTQESIPPLSRTTARDFASLTISNTAPQSHRDTEKSGGKQLRTTSRGSSVIAFPLLSLCLCDSVVRDLYALHRRVPDELMNLQTQASLKVVRQHPLRQLPRIEQTVRAVSRTNRVLAEGRRKQHRGYPANQMVTRYKVARKLIVGPVAQHEFDLVR